MPLVEVLGVEIRQYAGPEVRALVPRVIGQTEFARQQKSPRSRSSRKTNREEFLTACLGKSKDFYIELFDRAKAEGYEVSWGTKGFSMRYPMASGSLASIYYGYPPSEGGPSLPLFQAYLAHIEHSPVKDSLRHTLMASTSFIERGKHTLEIVVDDETANQLIRGIGHLLQVGKEHVMRAE
jgi:hypothetical protein